MEKDKEGVQDTSAPIDMEPIDFSTAKEEVEKKKYEYVHTFNRPFEYQGKSYTELHFDFDSLTGRDGLAIEKELQALGMNIIVPALSGEYLACFAARTCRESLGSDAFKLMKLRDFEAIKSKARNFFLSLDS